MSSTTTTPTLSLQRAAPRAYRGWLKRIAVALLLLASVGVLLATQTNAAGWVLLPALESALGCRASAGRIRVTLDGRILVRDLRLEAPGIDGPAARFLEAPELEARPVWTSLLIGRAELSGLSLRRPVVRVSIDQASAMNVSSLRASGGSGAGVLPLVQIVDGVVEFGEHGPGWYTPLNTFRVHGRLARADRMKPVYSVELAEAGAATPGVAPGAAISIVGQIDLAGPTAEVHLANVDLGRFRNAPAPSRVEELWRLMALQGQLSDAVFTYDAARGAAMTFRLGEVSLNVPVPIEPEDPYPASPEDALQVGPQEFGPSRQRVLAASQPPLLQPTTGLLAMRRVSGDVRLARDGVQVSLRGLIEDLPCQVSLTTDGYRADSALQLRFVANRFRVADEPRLLPFVPPLVKLNLRRFSGPTAEVDSVVEIRRGPPIASGPAPISVKGSVEFRDGSARFDRFRYPFRDMAGTVLFDDEKVDLVTITGKGPTGARLHATGRISPLTEDAGLDITVTALDVPMDDFLRAAVPPHRRETLDALFSGAAYARLVESGLVRPTEPPPEPASGAASSAPVFDLGGVSQIVVRVTREPGPGFEYLTDIKVTVPRAGLLPEAFPYPVVADSLSLHMTDEIAEADAPVVKGLTGASGSMHAHIDLAPAGQPDRYRVTAAASAVPIDPLLVQALPQGQESGWSPRRLVGDLGLSGAASCDASVFTREGDGNETGYEIGVRFEELSARPGQGRLLLEHVSGSLDISDEQIRVGDLAGRIGEGEFRAQLLSEGPRVSGGQTPALSLRAAGKSMPIDAPIECLVGVLAPTVGEAIAERRKQYAPSGQADCDFRLTDGPRGVDYRLGVSNAAGAGFELLGSRLTLVEPLGTLSVTPQRISLHGFGCGLRWEDTPCGALTLEGDWALDPGIESLLEVSLAEGRFESPVVRALASTLDGSLGSALEESRLEGAFACRGRAISSPERERGFEGELVPSSLSVIRGGVRVDFPEVNGKLTFERDHGRIEKVSAKAPSWSIEADGSWTARPAFALDMNLRLDAEGLPPEVLAIMPERVSSALKQAELSIGGKFALEDATLTFRASPGDGEARTVFRAGATFDDARLNIGLPLSKVTGRAEVEAELPAAPATPRVRVDLYAERFIAAGVPLADGRVTLRSGETPGLFVMPLFRASAHGGEIAATASLWNPERPSAGAAEASKSRGTRYEAEVRLSAVDFGALLHDLGAAANEKDAAGPGAQASESGERGALDATIGLAGVIGEEASKRGRGLLRVQGGRVLAMPGMVGLLRLSNLQPPIEEELEYASAGFYLRGQTVTFEHIEASSESLTIAGEGTMQWPGTDLNLRFNTHGERHVPLLSDLFEGLRNEFITTMVTGTAREPAYELVQLPATTRMLGTIFRGRPRPGSEADGEAVIAADKVEP